MKAKNFNIFLSSKQHKHAFTLIELLIALLLFSIVSFSLYMSLNGGLLYYRRSEEGLVRNHAIVLFLNKFTKELRNTFIFTPSPFEGDEKKISFPSVVSVYTEESSSDESVNVIYSYESGQLIRRQTPLRTDAEEKEKKQNMLSDVKGVRFSYGYWDEKEEELVWKKKWEADKKAIFPKAIKINFEVMFYDSDKKSLGTRKIEKKIWLPHGQWKEA